jgi:hypothetical protein
MQLIPVNDVDEASSGSEEEISDPEQVDPDLPQLEFNPK